MKCPIDDTSLQMMERQQIEIDYCPKCRGVWLDRGELDKLIERTAQMPYQSDNRESRSDRPRDYRNDPQYHKRKSFWTEIFD